MNRYHLSTFFLVLFAAVSVFADAAADKFNTAKTAFDLKQFEQARDGFDAFLTQYPTSNQVNDATFYIAESLLNLKQYAQAESYYNRLMMLGLNNQFARVALFRLGDIPYIQGNFDIAKPRLEEFVEKLDRDNSLQFVLYYLGDIAMRRNIPEEAEHYFKQSISMFPQGARVVESQIGLAWAKNQLGRQTEANEIFQTLMSSTDPKVAEPALYQWGVALFERGSYQEAITALTNFQTKFPTSTYYNDSLRVIARCKGRLKDYNGAIQILSQIPQMTTDDKLMKVRLLYGLKRSQEAYNLLTETERVAGPVYRDEIVLLKSVFLYDQKNWANCITQLETVLLPQYEPLPDTMKFNYLTVPNSTVNKLPDDSFLKACSLLALCYARNGETNKANATFREIQSTATLLGGSDLQMIAMDTSTRLNEIYAEGTTPPLAPIINYPGNSVAGSSRPNGSWGQGGYSRPDNFPNRQDDYGQWNGSNAGTGNNAANLSRPAISEAEARKTLRDCNSMFTAGRYSQADTGLRNLITRLGNTKNQNNDNNTNTNLLDEVKADALILRSKAVFKLGRDPEAVDLLESVLDEFPSSPQAAETLWHLGFYYYETCSDSATAVKYFQQLLERFPNNKNIDGALYYIALNDWDNGNGRTAAANLNRIYRNYSNGRYWSHAVWSLAYQSYKKRDYAQAETYIQKLLNHPPDAAVLDKVLYLKGTLALKKNEFDTAFVAFREVGKLCPESPLYESATKNAQLAAGKVATATR
ncbi:MAG: tetratricopeptide repeat protein [Planctomycetaceae bacterium]|nr:tetratricopeptide repeat protein [Planctomycetaceae bacterium]